MNTLSATDALGIINHGNSIFVIGNGIHRAGEFTGSLQMGNGIIGTGRRTFSALLTLLGVNMGTMSSHLNGSEFAGIDTSLSHTVLTIFRHRVAGNRAVLTGGADDLNDISVIMLSRRLPLRQTNTLTDDFPLFIDTAPKLWNRSRNQPKRNVIPLGIQSSLKGQPRHFPKYLMLDFNHIDICVHTLFLSYPTSAPIVPNLRTKIYY